MKKVFICGDSFASMDPEYGSYTWTEQLAQMGINQFEINNLSSVCASNLLIKLQAEKAIESRADFIIVLGTTSTRNEVCFRDVPEKSKLIDRFYRINHKDGNVGCDLSAYSYSSINHTTAFSDEQLLLLKQYVTEFVDLDLEIYKNQSIIEGTLSKLVASNIPFVFDQGGFEHPSFSDSVKTYFSEYKKYISPYNIWDYAVGPKQHRPYFHIIDPAIHKEIAGYYYQRIIDEI